MLSWSIRVGVSTPDDPEGRAGPGNWWMTGGCQPSYQPGYGRRRSARTVLRSLRQRVHRGHQASSDG